MLAPHFEYLKWAIVELSKDSKDKGPKRNICRISSKTYAPNGTPKVSSHFQN